MQLYQLVVTFLLLVPLSIAVWNFLSFAAIRRGERPRRTPRVSLLVPARNEERGIGRCVASLMDQDYPDFEVVALDDGSDDRTGAILDELGARGSNLRVIRGEPLPNGWVGKNWACHQLAESAEGEWLVFVDADTIHHRESLSAAMAFAERCNVEFFSGVPHHTLHSLPERAIIPTVIFLYFAYLPNRWITERRDPKFSATNGQFLAASRGAYERIGGHQSVRGQLVEDVWLGRAAKRAGVRTALAGAVETVESRMYESFGEIVAGFSKNLFPGLDYSVSGLAFFIISTLLLYVAPLGFVVAAVASSTYTVALFWLPMIQLVIGAAMRLLLAVRFRLGAEQAVLQPLGAVAITLIALNSARWAFSRRGATWKGRSYGRVK